MWIRSRWMVIMLAIHASARAADNPRHIDPGPGITAVKALEQNWTDVESNWFYNVPQGSRLLPYDWFLHLEQVGSQDRFRNANHIRAVREGLVFGTALPLHIGGSSQVWEIKMTDDREKLVCASRLTVFIKRKGKSASTPESDSPLPSALQ